MDVLKLSTSIQALCPACGLCCNGVLFADVELQRGDEAKRLQGAGLVLRRKGRKTCFAQPCGCFDGRLCQNYADRPVRCREFECGVLKRVAAGRMAVDEGLVMIRKARRQAEKVRRILRKLGQEDESMALTHRYAEVMAAPMDMAEDNGDSRGKLLVEMGKLMEMAQKEFLKAVTSDK